MKDNSLWKNCRTCVFHYGMDRCEKNEGEGGHDEYNNCMGWASNE